MLQRSSGFLPPVHTTCRVGFGVFSVKPGCHSSGSIRNLLVYLPPTHRVKKTPRLPRAVSAVRNNDWADPLPTALDKNTRLECHIFETESARAEAVANNKTHGGRSEVYVREARRGVGGLRVLLRPRPRFGGGCGAATVFENVGEEGLHSASAARLSVPCNPERFFEPAKRPAPRNKFEGYRIVVHSSQRQSGRDPPLAASFEIIAGGAERNGFLKGLERNDFA